MILLFILEVLAKEVLSYVYGAMLTFEIDGDLLDCIAISLQCQLLLFEREKLLIDAGLLVWIAK